jgi:CP family cyanate transporter-like MFS transporter
VLATAVYTTGISLGAATSAALAVPLSDVLGGWRGSLTAFSLFTAALVLVWIGLTRGYGDRSVVPGPLPRLPLRSRTGWLLVAIFSFTSISYYGINAWLPSSFSERGWSHASAGALLTVLNAVTVPVTIGLALRGDHFGSRRFWIAAGAVLQLAGLLGVIAAPAGGWLWAALIGAGIGLLFPSVMTMPLDVADRPADVGAMAALMLGAGYTLSAVAPFLLGVLRDAAGSFTVGLWVVFADTGLILGVLLLTSNERLRRRPGRAGAAEGPLATAGLATAPGPAGSRT